MTAIAIPDLPESFILPDLLALLPYEGTMNPHYTEASIGSGSWLDGFDNLSKRKRAAIVQANNELLCAFAYSYAEREKLLTCFDLVKILFLIDEVSDEQTGEDAHSTGQVFLAALRDAAWDDGSPLAKVTKELRERLSRVDVPACHRRLMKHAEDYIDAVVMEAELRERNEVLDIESFMPHRRESSGVPLCFAIFGYVLGADLPDEIFYDPVMMRMYLAVVDMVCWSNDLYSYDVEQVAGRWGSNILTVLITQNGWDFVTAVDHVGAHFKELMDGFQSDKAKLPSWGHELDLIVMKFVAALEMWVVGSCEWSFRITRYFGAEHNEVKRTRVVRIHRCTKKTEWIRQDECPFSK